MVNRLNSSFIDSNKVFWDKFRESDTNDILLVETSAHPITSHANAVVAKMVACAKHLRIAWLEDKNIDNDRMRSYSANSIFLKYLKINFFMKFWLLTNSMFFYLFYVAIKNKLLSFKYKKIPYGDFVYDGYLSFFSMATLHRFDFRIVVIFYLLLLRDQKARLILNSNPVKAILVSHYIGLNAGPLSRVAMQANIPVYLNSGGNQIIALSVFRSLDQIYDYPVRPSKETVDILAREHGKTVETNFKKFVEEDGGPFYGAFSVAYDNTIFSDVTREDFLKTMDLDDKPIIFVMLHAFNDYPHSGFGNMLFRDYYDWFIKTFRFAKNDKSKNWIFKEHPGDRFYKTIDLNLNRVMRNLPDHIRFISHDSDIKASTVLNVADMIITCMGTAGVEMPALRGIPAVVAGTSFYNNLGFTIEPKSKKEYFNILKEARPKTLSPEQRLRARCCYLYAKKYCIMPFSSGPAVTLEEALKVKIDENFYISCHERILNLYKERKDMIYNEFIKYTNEIRRNDFTKMTNMMLP